MVAQGDTRAALSYNARMSDPMPQLPAPALEPVFDLTVTVATPIEAGAITGLNSRGRRRIIPGRTANATQALPGRSACQYRDACWLGCPYGAYFSTQSSTLPVAMKTGNLTVRPFSIVTQVLYDKDKKRARGVEVLDSETNQTYEFTSKIVFLNASILFRESCQ